MSQGRSRSDDILFISALLILLLGAAFLLFTTQTIVGLPRAWPLLVIAVGGAMLYFALARGASFSFFFVGLLFVLEGSFSFLTTLLGWKLAQSWPLGMAVAGLAGFITGLAAKQKLKAFFAVPSIGFAVLGSVFAVFSFKLARVNFKSFIAVWWPTILIAGGISLFVAYGLSRRASAQKAEQTEGHQSARPGKSADRSKNDRGPLSGP